MDIISLVISTISVVIALAAFLNNRSQQKKDQANKICAWIPEPGDFKDGKMRVRVANTSDLPVYQVAISMGVFRGAGCSYFTGNDNNTLIALLPPGEYEYRVPFMGGGMHMHFEPAISFQDAQGQNWRRDATGKLSKTHLDPYEELEIEQPAHLER